MNTISLFGIIVFLIGIFFYVQSSSKYVEGFDNKKNNRRCPNLLIQKGAKFYLYNSKQVQVPGVNPVEFDNLEDYTEFLDWQRSQGVRCPVLYLQSSYDAQGNQVYTPRPSVFNPQAGIPTNSTVIIETPKQPLYDELNSDTIQSVSLENSVVQKYPNFTLLTDATRDDYPYNTNSYPAYDNTSFYVGTSTPQDILNDQ